jgi:hypothetical protein
LHFSFKAPRSRVTRLACFRPMDDCLLCASILKINVVTHTFGDFFHG